MNTITGRPEVSGSLRRMLRFERSLVRIRWFGIAFGAFQIAFYKPYPGTVAPRSMYVLAGASVVLLAATNLTVILRLRGRVVNEPTIGRLGALAFGGDLVALWAVVWAFTFEEFGATWVVLSIVTLEGALRYELRGAFFVLAASIPMEILREAHRVADFDFVFYADGFTFRLGFIAIIAAIGGVMARNLNRERAAAELRAAQLADLATREHEARAESTAFQDVILAGVSARGLTEALQSMIDHIAERLGYQHITVLMSENGYLRPWVMRGFSDAVRDTHLEIGQGISGTVVVTGATEIIADVRADPRYYAAEETTRSQVTVPIRLGDEIIGVLDCESPEVGAFGQADASRLERLAAQMALVIENARLLAQERQTVERLKELDLMRSDFIAIASHELRTPLTAIQGSVKTLRRPEFDRSPSHVDEFLGILERQADRLARLIEDLLMVSHIDAGGVSLRMEDVDLDSVFTDVLAEIGGPATRVSVALPPAFEPIRTDGHRLRQIVRNLVENAVKFSADDTTVRVSAHLEGARLRIEVADDGPGIPPDEQEMVFERFYQIGGSLRRRGEGFGLGLYITRRLVEALGGTIELSSVPQRGTTFRVWVPAHVASAAENLDIA